MARQKATFNHGLLDELEVEIGFRVQDLPSAKLRWSGDGVNRVVSGGPPNPAVVFQRVVAVIDRFVDFERSVADQRTLCELCACFVLSTYFLDGFNVIGYLWPTGDRGCGKTNLLIAICEVAYLGMVILAGGTYATLRDLADYGATLGFDDCEAMDKRRADPDKRALMLAGNRRGATVTVKEKIAPGVWKTRHVNAYCPRLFSAIGLPDDVMGSRCIAIPLVRSLDDSRTNVDPLDHDAWPHRRRQLVDDLWALGLANLPRIREYERRAAQRARLGGRNLDPWRAILAVALWLQEECGVAGLFDRLEELSVTYQAERAHLEAGDEVRLLVLALTEMLGVQGEMEFETSRLTGVINKLSHDLDLEFGPGGSATPQRVGRLLQRLRFQKAPRTATRKKWKVTRDDLSRLGKSYGLEVGTPGGTGIAGNSAQSAMPSCQ